MIIKIADKHSFEKKIMTTYFSAPVTEPKYVYFHYNNGMGEEAHFEIDADAIIELGKELEARKNKLEGKKIDTEIQASRINKAEKVRILRFLSDLKGLKGFHGWVPKDVAPSQDKGVYFEKLGLEIEHLIKKYEKTSEGM